MTRQIYDNWLRIDLEIKESLCESDYNISSRPVGSEKVAISPLFSTSTQQTQHNLDNAGLMLNHRIRRWPIISCNFSSPSRQHVVYAEVQDNNTYLRKKEGVSIFADCERDLILSARRSCLVIVD